MGEWDTAYGTLATPVAGDDLLIRDLSATPPAGGTVKRVTAGTLLGAPQVTTGITGYTLVNGTGTVISWTPPADGLLHRFTVTSTLVVTSGTTGGNIQVTFNDPGGNARTPQLYSPTQSTGMATPTMSSAVHTCQGGTAVTVFQQTAMTAGAAVLYAEIWGSLWR